MKLSTSKKINAPIAKQLGARAVEAARSVTSTFQI